MRATLAAASLAAVIGLVCCQSAGAVPAAAPTLKAAATAVSALHRAQYSERRTRRGIVKCYREAIFGPYRCHRYSWW